MSDVTDFLGNKLEINDYFAYALTLGRSAQQAIFQYKGKNPSGTYKARPVSRSYERNEYKVWITNKSDPRWVGGKEWGCYVDMTDVERAKVDAKTSTLHCVPERAVKLFDFKE